MGSLLSWAAVPQELETKEQFQQVLGSVDTILFDCDGVLWTGDGELVPGAKEAVQFVRSQSKSVYFVTNNSSRSRQQYLRKFIKLGIDATEDEIFCTGYVAAYYLKHVLQLTGKVYLLGLSGFGDELSQVGIPFIGPGEDQVTGGVKDWLSTPLDPEVSAVVVGFDMHFSYPKLIKACSYLQKPDCHFIATNEDSSLPSHSEVMIPGTGCLVRSIRYGADRDPVIMGKPCQPMFEVIQGSTRLNPAKTLMIGDRMNTDIAFGRSHGLRTLLVLTGVAKREDINSAPSDHTPHYFTDSVADLLKCSS